ncbi:MAG: peptide-methionine (S)-S-oxide reductase MsrA [Actinomycetota bacterium]|jgi:peptide-methionine (S)-S-oxide reductase
MTSGLPHLQTLYVGLGCFWGAEKKFWNTPGVVETEVGYQGGHGIRPTYREVCTGLTGHAENVKVVYDESIISTRDILRIFWENHDPTQGNRQGNDIGTQYRSVVYWTNEKQELVVRETLASFSSILTTAGLDPITTEIGNADQHTFWPAEEYHQKYLQKNPNGYDCHAHTGFHLPNE